MATDKTIQLILYFDNNPPLTKECERHSSRAHVKKSQGLDNAADDISSET